MAFYLNKAMLISFLLWALMVVVESDSEALAGSS